MHIDLIPSLPGYAGRKEENMTIIDLIKKLKEEYGTEEKSKEIISNSITLGNLYIGTGGRITPTAHFSNRLLTGNF